MAYKLGIDIGGTKVGIGLLDENNRLAYRQAVETPQKADWRSALRWISEQLEEVCQSAGIQREQIASCGIGIPGTVSTDGRRAVKVPNLSWTDASIADEFERLTGIRTRLLQDSRAAAYGEYRLGGGIGRKLLVCVTLGTGIGTGIVIGGELFGGALGAAGELGHIPAVPGGRACGCGKRGCLECYAAGKGLALSAREAFGPNSGTHDLFRRAEAGDEKACRILNEAVILLGDALVSMMNLLSPDCLLFSGGLSCREKLFTQPLRAYIEEHIYCAEGTDKPEIASAHLGEDAPLIGAALYAEDTRIRRHRLSASVMCADMLHIADEFRRLEEAGIDYLHWDVMDGHFVPNLMLPIEMINKTRAGARLPFDIHLMTEYPERLIPQLDLRPGDIVSIHWESTPHVQRALTLIRAAGASPALALNPSTPMECVRELLDDIAFVLLMTVNPGFAGQKLVSQSLSKIKRMRCYLDELGHRDIGIEVDGNCSFENVPRMLTAGADMFVVGSSSVFHPQLGILEGTKRLLSVMR